jgi:uncharacterized membrane protein (DUF2068 family)
VDVEAARGPAGGRASHELRTHYRYELLSCGLHGHLLVGTDAAELRPVDGLIAREHGGYRWHRCLRCDTWQVVEPPSEPTRPFPPERDDIELPLRGKPLRDRYVLRAIALERVVHLLVLAILAAAVFLFATHRDVLHHEYTTILADLQGGLGGPVGGLHSSLVQDLNGLFALDTSRLYEVGGALCVYLVLLFLESVGLWYAKRWAEYLTVFETGLLVPFEVYELTSSVSVLKVLTLLLNLAVVVYLLFAHRLLGVRGGGRAAAAERRRDIGWPALERVPPSLDDSGY